MPIDIGNGPTKRHEGIDFATSASPIKAAAAGYAIASHSDTYDKFVIIFHSNNMSTLYAHLSSTDTSAGIHSVSKVVVDTATPEANSDLFVWVDRGDTIGISGSLGEGSTGDHLHFELARNASRRYANHINNRLDPFDLRLERPHYPGQEKFDGCGPAQMWRDLAAFCPETTIVGEVRIQDAVKLADQAPNRAGFVRLIEPRLGRPLSAANVRSLAGDPTSPAYSSNVKTLVEHLPADMTATDVRTLVDGVPQNAHLEVIRLVRTRLRYPIDPNDALLLAGDPQARAFYIELRHNVAWLPGRVTADQAYELVRFLKAHERVGMVKLLATRLPLQMTAEQVRQFAGSHSDRVYSDIVLFLASRLPAGLSVADYQLLAAKVTGYQREAIDKLLIPRLRSN